MKIDKLTILCATFLVFATIAALTVLIVTNHDATVTRFATTIGTQLGVLGTLLGVARKLSKVDTKVDHAKKTADDTNSKLTNGFVGEKLDALLSERGLLPPKDNAETS